MGTLQDFINHFSDIERVSLELKKIRMEGNHCSVAKEFHVVHKLKRIMEEIEFVKNNREKFFLLTDREKQIIKILASGLNNAEIAKRLFISRRTVEQHRKNINRKLQVSSFVQLNAFAYAFDLV